MALTVIINGQAREFEELGAGATVLELIAALGLKGDRVALELNGEIAARTAWGVTELAEGDKVEVVHFVGGGRGQMSAPM
jgi:sulfur carrier protein